MSATLALTLLLAPLPALAQPAPAQPEPPTRRLDRLDRTVRELNQIVRQGASTGRPIVVVPETLPAEFEQLRTRLDDLEASQRSQVSTIEALTGELAQARRATTAAESRVQTLEARLAAIEARPAETAETNPPPVQGDATATTTAAPPRVAGSVRVPNQRAADEGSLGSLRSGEFPVASAAAFQRARQQLLEGDYPAAAAGFEDFVARFPDDAQASEARYWLGETRFIREDYAASAEAYIAALRGWPKASWAPDAVVKLSSSLVALNRNPTACQALSELDRRYPEASTAVKQRAQTVRGRAQCSAA